MRAEFRPIATFVNNTKAGMDRTPDYLDRRNCDR